MTTESTSDIKPELVFERCGSGWVEVIEKVLAIIRRDFRKRRPLISKTALSPQLARGEFSVNVRVNFQCQLQMGCIFLCEFRKHSTCAGQHPWDRADNRIARLAAASKNTFDDFVASILIYKR